MNDVVRLHDELSSADAAKILKGSEFEVLNRARADVASAEQQAANILAQAQAEAERIRDEAQETGKREVARLLSEHTVSISRDLGVVESKVAAIVMNALNRILDPIPSEKLVVAAVRRAVSEVDLSRGATLIMAPEMMPKVQKHLEHYGLDSATLELSGDPSCPPDSTILRTHYGDIELNVDAQMAALSEGIEAALAEKGRDS